MEGNTLPTGQAVAMDDEGVFTEEGDRFDVGHYISQVGHYALLDLNEGERS